MIATSKFGLHALLLVIAMGGACHGAGAVEVVEGSLIADLRGHVSAQMTGERSQRVEEMLVRIGDRVKKGDVLARLNTVQLQSDRLISVRALEEARASVEVSKSALARARLEFNRRSGLKGSPSFNRAGYEDAEVDLGAAESRLQSSQSLALRREAELARIDVEISLAEIKAPVDGVVVDVSTNVGASVTQRSPDLLTLLDLSRVEIAVKVPKGQDQLLKPGQSVGYALPDGKKRMARVRAVLPPLTAQDTAPVARLDLDSADLPATIRHNQPVKVFLGE